MNPPTPLSFLLLHPPKRAQPEPPEGHRKQNRQPDSPGSRLSRLVLCVLPKESSGSDHREHNEDESRHFQPELPQDASEMARRDPTCMNQRTYAATPACLFGRNPRENAQFSCLRGNVRHCRRFYQSSGLEYPHGEDVSHETL